MAVGMDFNRNRIYGMFTHMLKWKLLVQFLRTRHSCTHAQPHSVKTSKHTSICRSKFYYILFLEMYADLRTVSSGITYCCRGLQ